MSAELQPGVQLEICNVLFMDVVGYSKLLLDEQRELQQQLNQIVRNTEQVRAAESAGKLIRIPTGDGMALVFFNSPETPVRCAIEIAKKLKEHPELRLRMGIHSGPVNEVRDVNDQVNIAGAGINTAQRVMDCGDAGHILLSRHVADDLKHYRQWQPQLHDLGECAVKHGERVNVVNLYSGELGNPQLPEKFRRGKRWKMLGPRSTSGRDGGAAIGPWRVIGVDVAIIGAVAVGVSLFFHRIAIKSANATILNSSTFPASAVSVQSIAGLSCEN